MNSSITVSPALDERYRAINRALDKALLKYHPDHAGNTEQAERMTRILISTKESLRKKYKDLKTKGEF